MSPVDPLNRFAPATRHWFAGTFAAPTPAQTEAWAADWKFQLRICDPLGTPLATQATGGGDEQTR